MSGVAISCFTSQAKSVPVRSRDGAGCRDRLDRDVDIAVDVDAPSRPDVTGRLEAEVEAVLHAPLRISGELANAGHRLRPRVEDPRQGERVGRNHLESERRV
jgi:hypothetical protein